MIEKPRSNLSTRTKIATFMILFLIPVTIYMGINYMDDRKYMFISSIILLQTMLPFFMIFEDRKPQTRELILIAGLTAIGTAGRLAFFWLPQFKPVMAVTIVTAASLGPEAGFLVGAFIAFTSNFFLGQGPWTPWQMFATGIIGFLFGLLVKFKILKPNLATMSIFGFIATLIIYGGIMDPASVIMFGGTVNKDAIIAAYISGFSFNLIYASATFLFLLFLGMPLMEKIHRIQVKYGLIE